MRKMPRKIAFCCVSFPDPSHVCAPWEIWPLLLLPADSGEESSVGGTCAIFPLGGNLPRRALLNAEQDISLCCADLTRTSKSKEQSRKVNSSKVTRRVAL